MNAAAPPTTDVSVVILEDHAMMRAFLTSRLEAIDLPVTVTYAGASVLEAIEVIREAPPNCVVLDLDLGDDSSATQNLEAIHETGVPVLIVSASAAPQLVQASIGRGARGYVSKQCEPEEFDRAFRAIVDGEVYVSRDLAMKLAVSRVPSVVLSPQEQRALTLYASGMKLEAVARTMGVGPGTVREYIKRVREKYASAGERLPSKVDLYRKAKEEGLL